MDIVFAQVPPLLFAYACAVAVLAGMIKGIVGFAMPMVFVSLLSSVMPPSLALAGLILPTLVTNLVQATRQGLGPVAGAIRDFRVFLGIGILALLISAQMVQALSQDLLLALIGGVVLSFTLLQLAGWRPRPAKARRAVAEAGMGAIAGFIGGLSGIWGPPTVMLLTMLDTPKQAQMQIQGVIYGLGALALTGAHIGSGILTWHTALFSALLIPPALLGTRLGLAISDRFDQATFRRATLVVLLVAALNLLRRALMG